MARTRRTQETFDKVALALGHVCIEWGRLEQGLDEFIDLLAPLETGDVSRSITSSLDIRSKIQTIKALAYLRKHSDEWFADMSLILDYIDNNLRPRRNQYVHAGWFLPKEGLIRRKHQIKFTRPQSFQLTLQTQVNSRTQIREINQLARELSDLFFLSRSPLGITTDIPTDRAHCLESTGKHFYAAQGVTRTDAVARSPTRKSVSIWQLELPN